MSSSPSPSAVHIAPTSAGGAARAAARPFQLRALAGYIGGKWVGARSGRTIAVTNPADGATVTVVPDMGAEDTRAAIEAAEAAFPAWAAKTAFERAAVVRRMQQLLLEHAEGLGVLLSLETGKPLEEAKGEVKYAADFFEWYSEEGKRAYGEVLPPMRGDRRMLVLQQPVGPCAALTPWNFPAAMPARKVAPALAAGCPVILRPSINTPLSAIAMAQIAEDAGVPPGVFNVVLGDDHAATAGVICAAPEVRKLSFTGSTPVGKQLMAQCSGTLKRLSLELGGRAPFIVFEDADIDAAVEGAMVSKFRNAGQTCVCANTLFVHERVHDAFVERLAAKVRALKVGDGLVPGVAVGPLIHGKALKAAETFVADAVAKGARVVTGGKACAGTANGGKGNFFEPTVLVDVAPDMRCVLEEIFAPIAPISKFTSEEEVLRIANGSTVGLAGYFFTRDLARAWRVAERLEVGMVGVNTGIISFANAPFGGIKGSGFGREGSRHGLEEYLQLKYVMMGV